MKPLSDQDHYEILEVSRQASSDAIERAYRIALSTYADDSLAGYSVFGAGDSSALLERVEIAHRVLTDPDARRAYDALLSSDGGPASPPLAPLEMHDEAMGPLDAGIPAAPPDVAPHQARLGIEELTDLDGDSSEFDGARLRRSRLHRGMELEEIAGVTKINPAYLRFIEEDRFAELPAPVYVRGFVAAYAECMGLDSKRVAASYMRNFESAKQTSHRGRFLGGR